MRSKNSYGMVNANKSHNRAPTTIAMTLFEEIAPPRPGVGEVVGLIVIFFDPFCVIPLPSFIVYLVEEGKREK